MQLVSVLTRCPDDQWHLQGRANLGIARVFLQTI